MKCDRMLKAMLIGLFCFSGWAALFANAAPASGHPVEEREGHGGAGIERNGELMTFFNAGLYVEPEPRKDIDVPSLNTLIERIKSFTFLSKDTRDTLEANLVSSPNHRYFAVDSKYFPNELKKRLVAEFKRVHPTESKIRLFALTDTNTKTTFLLPNFFKLPPEGQMAILFHEVYWLFHPKTTYEEVVGAETSFQAVLSQPTNSYRILKFLKYLPKCNTLIAIVQSDLATGSLNGFLKEYYGRLTFTFADLFGSEYWNCRWHVRDRDACTKYRDINLSHLVSGFPNSLFLQFIQENLGELHALLKASYFDNPDLPEGQSYGNFSRATTDTQVDFKLSEPAELLLRVSKNGADVPVKDQRFTFDVNGKEAVGKCEISIGNPNPIPEESSLPIEKRTKNNLILFN